MNSIIHVHLPDSEVVGLLPLNNQQMRLRFADGSEVVLDRSTMVRCEAIWQVEAEKGNADAPEPPMPGVLRVPTNEDPLVKEAVAKLVGLWTEANDDMVTWVSEPLEEASVFSIPPP
jgi:hypothetical protein